MENRKDIGKAFREKLGGLEKSPRDGVWRSLNGELAIRRKHVFITGWLRNIAITGIVLLLFTIFTYPLWQDYMPHIYLVMPNDKKDTAPTKVNAASEDAFTTHGEAAKPGKATGVNETDNAAVTQANDPEAISSGTNTSHGINSNNNLHKSTRVNNGYEGTSGSAVARENNNDTEATGITGIRKRTNSTSGGRATTASSARRTDGATGAGNGKQSSSVGKNTGSKKTAGRSADASNTVGGTPVESTNAITQTKINTTVGRKNINNLEKNSQAGITGNNKDNEGNTGNNKTTGSNTVPVAANEKNTLGNTDNSSTKNTDGSTVAGVKNDTDPASGLTHTDSLSVADEGKTADSLAAADFKPYKMDFAKVADSLRDLYGREEKTADKKKGDTIPYKKLYAYAFGAPMQFALPKTGEYLDDNLGEQSVSSKASFAYGAYLGYNITRKLSIRLGAIKTKGELVTNNVLLETTFIEHEPDEENPDGWVEVVPPANFSGVEYNEGASGSSIAAQLGESNGNSDFPSATVNIRNNFEFLEVPVELTYRLYDGSFGIGLFSGFVTRYTKENTVFAENAMGSIQLGKMKNLEEVNHAISFGGSFHYNIMPNLQLNVEPVYKYYFNNRQFLRPHTYSIQFGLRYDFGFWNKKK